MNEILTRAAGVAALALGVACAGSPAGRDTAPPARDGAPPFVDQRAAELGPPADGAPAGDLGADGPAWSCAPPYESPRYQQPPDDGVALEALLEAAGYASGAQSAWVGVAAGDLCGGPEPELVLLKNAHSYFSVLRGPTPHAVGSGDLASSAAHPWRGVAAADLDGDGKHELFAARKVSATGVADLVLARASASCAVSQLAEATVGTPANSDWVGVAAGDFDGDGQPELAALKQQHSSFVFLRYAGGKLSVYHSSDLGTLASAPWRALGAGDLDGDGKDELVAARWASDGAASTVVAYRWNGSTFVELAAATVGNTGNSEWAGLAVGDFDGDGRAAVALAKNQASRFIVLDLPPGANALATRRSAELSSASGQPWRGLAAADWLGGDGGAQELVAARQIAAPYRVNVFVHGAAWHRAPRDSALLGTEAQYAGEPHPTADAPADLVTLKGWLTETHAGSYSYLLWDTTGQDYLDLVRFLDETRDFCVDGRQLRVWVTLIPPTETQGERCSRAAASPLTAFDEASFFAKGLTAASCADYVGWAALLGRLAQQYPHLVAVNVDDFTHNTATTFTPEVIAAMQSRMRELAPWLTLVPTFYFRQGGTPVGQLWPDLGLSLDSLLFYFRNEQQGEGPCASCPTPGSCTNACLAGTCAEATVKNAAGEIAQMAALLAPGRKLQLGAYFSGHSRCGEPSAKYDYDLFETALGLPTVGGVTVYTTQHPQIACTDATYLQDKGCVVQRIFANH